MHVQCVGVGSLTGMSNGSPIDVHIRCFHGWVGGDTERAYLYGAKLYSQQTFGRVHRIFVMRVHRVFEPIEIGRHRVSTHDGELVTEAHRVA